MPDVRNKPSKRWSAGMAARCTQRTEDAARVPELAHRALSHAVAYNDALVAVATRADATSSETIASRPAECFTFRGAKVRDLLPADDRDAYPSYLDPKDISMTERFDEQLGILLRNTDFDGASSVVATTVGAPSDADFAATP